MTEEQLREAIRDEEHLKLLSIGYLVSAGMSAVLSLFALMYVFIGVFFTALVSHTPVRQGQEPPPEIVGWIISVAGLAFFSGMVVLAALKFRTARCLKQRKSKTFCMAIAAISCLGIPWGTLLGVLTLLVLSRPSVSRLFGEPLSATAVPTVGAGSA